MVSSWLLWQIIFLPWIANPGVTTVASLMGWTSLENFADKKIGVLIIGTIGNVLGILAVIYGVKVYARVQKVVVAWAALAMISLAVLLTVTSRHAFISDWN